MKRIVALTLFGMLPCTAAMPREAAVLIPGVCRSAVHAGVEQGCARYFPLVLRRVPFAAHASYVLTLDEGRTLTFVTSHSDSIGLLPTAPLVRVVAESAGQRNEVDVAGACTSVSRGNSRVVMMVSCAATDAEGLPYNFRWQGAGREARVVLAR